MMRASSRMQFATHIHVVQSAACPPGCLLFITERESVLLHNVVTDSDSKWTAFRRAVRTCLQTVVCCARAVTSFEARR